MQKGLPSSVNFTYHCRSLQDFEGMKNYSVIITSFAFTLYLSYSLSTSQNSTEDSKALASAMLVAAATALYVLTKYGKTSLVIGGLVFVSSLGAYQLSSIQVSISLSIIVWFSIVPSILLWSTQSFFCSVAAGLSLHLFLTPTIFQGLTDSLSSLECKEAASIVLEIVQNFQTSTSRLMITLIVLNFIREFEHSKYTESLKNTLLQVEVVAKSTEAFFAAISHDLRNPLNW